MKYKFTSGYKERKADMDEKETRLAEEIFLKGLCSHIRCKFGFGGEVVPLESTCSGPVTISFAFSVGGIGWTWSLRDDDISRAPAYDDVVER